MPFIAARVYMKPLLPTQPLRGLDIDTVLNKSKRDLLRRIRARLLQAPFSMAARKALSRALKVEIKPSSLQVTVNHPAFRPLVDGQQKQQMRWLTKAVRPIPILLDSGKLIFRNATAKSMRQNSFGKKGWVHPGRPPSDFVDKAKAESRAFLKEKLRKELTKQLKTGWARAGR